MDDPRRSPNYCWAHDEIEPHEPPDIPEIPPDEEDE